MAKKLIALVLTLVMMIPVTAFASATTPIADIPSEYDLEPSEVIGLVEAQHGVTITREDAEPEEEIVIEYEGMNDIAPGKEAGEGNWDGISTTPPGTVKPGIQPFGGATSATAQSITIGYSYYDSISGGAVDWFMFTVPANGQYNFYTTGSTDTYGELYKLNWLGNLELITSNDDGGENTNFMIQVGLNMNTTYYIKVRGYSTLTSGSYYLYPMANQDSYYASGASCAWIPQYNTPDPDGIGYDVLKISYYDRVKATGLINLMRNDKWRTVRDWAISGGVAYATSQVVAVYAIKYAVAAAMAELALNWAVFPSITDLEVYALESAGGGYDADGLLRNGVQITSSQYMTGSGYMQSALSYSYWSGSYAYGQKYYRGYFTTNPDSIRPVWR